MSQGSSSPAAEWVVNEAPTGRRPRLMLGQLWHHRELLFFFAERDVKVRYKQAFLGVAWVGLQPLLGALTFTILFNRLADVDVSGRSYFAFALAGFVGWNYFSSALSAGTGSLLYNSDLLTKVAFPKILTLVATLLPGLIDLSIGVVLALGISVASGDGFSPVQFIFGLPIGVLLIVITVAGPALFFGALVVRYRDAAVVVTFMLQFLLFASPIAYPPELVPQGWRTVLYLNPVSGAVGLLRGALTNADLPTAPQLLISGSMALLLLLVGLTFFRSNERQFADII